MKRIIHTDNAPHAIGAYSQAVKSADTLYVSGQIPMHPRTMTLIEGDFKKQATQAFANLSAIIEAAGATLNDTLKLTIYLTDLNHFDVTNEVMSTFFSKPFPARACIEVKALPKGAHIEIDAIVNLTEK